MKKIVVSTERDSATATTATPAAAMPATTTSAAAASATPTADSQRPRIDRRRERRWYVPRIKAATVHFLLSVLVVASATYVLAAKWYPGALVHASGGVKLLLMIAVIDLIMGPVLTFVVFDRRKKSLPFDIGFIAVLQIGALAYGLNASYQGRPVYMVFVVDRFELVSAADVDPGEQKLVAPPLRTIPSNGPRLVAFRPPTGEREKLELGLASASGIDARYFLRYYVEYERLAEQALTVSRPASELVQHNDPAVVERELAKLLAAGHKLDDLRFLPLQGRREDLSMIVTARDAQVISAVRLRPWGE